MYRLVIGRSVNDVINENYLDFSPRQDVSEKFREKSRRR